MRTGILRFAPRVKEARDRIDMLYQEISNLQKKKSLRLEKYAPKDEVLLIDSQISALQIEVEKEKNQKDQALMRVSQLKRRIQLYKETVTTP